MDRHVSSHIAKVKKSHHNIYGLNRFVYRFIVMLCISLWVLLFFDVQTRHFSLSVQISIWGTTITVALFATMISLKSKRISIIPYCRKEDFQFLGLYDLKEINPGSQDDVLSRDEEIRYMHQILEETILPQVSVKQALCITGPSGSGKSIILNFFKHAYKDEYKFFDFSGNYHEFSGYMISQLGTNIDRNISEMTSSGKVIFILDQFERFFFLSENEQEKIRDIIRCLCKKNTGVIVSLREEYLADFLKRFDMNNLLSDDNGQYDVSSGILRKISSVVERKNDMYSAPSSHLRPVRTTTWEGYVIKNNASVHLDTHEGYGHAVMEKIGTTLLYCRNQNEMSFQLNGQSFNASILESKCRNLFGEKGSSLFSRHIHEPLIEQQIIFHMAEFNSKIFQYTEEALCAFMEKDNNELLGQYFDNQLASCDNYFHASRLLYLLSQARLHQISLKTKDLENYLFPDLFAKKGHAQLMNVIKQLETIQLIRKNTEGSGQEYEIAHDFIASAYLNYCSTNMNRSVKNALDLFISEHMDDRRNASFQEKISYRKEVYGQHFYRNATCFAVAFMSVVYLLQRFVFNPWTTIWKDFNPYGAYIPAFPLFITILSVIYLCYMSDKTVKYYRGEKAQVFKAVYILLMSLASMAVVAYPHFIFFDGIDLAVASLYIAFLLDERYRQTSRNELQAYGAKSCMIGLVFAFVHIYYFSVNPLFDDYLISSEFIMFTILVGYAFFAHMTQEFLFARMSDASSERL